MTEEMKLEKESKKQRCDETAAQYKASLQQRRALARRNIDSNKFPERMTAAKATKADSMCPVCDLPYNKSSNPERDMNWHVVAYKKSKYCPFADSDDTRAVLAAAWRNKADKKNEAKRLKRSSI